MPLLNLRRARPVVASLCLATAVTLAVAGCAKQGTGAPAADGGTHRAASQPLTAPPAADAPPIVKGLPDFTTLVDRYGPAVVNVAVVEKGRSVSSDEDTDAPANDPLNDFLRRFGGTPHGGLVPQPPQQLQRGVTLSVARVLLCRRVAAPQRQRRHNLADERGLVAAAQRKLHGALQ